MKTHFDERLRTALIIAVVALVALYSGVLSRFDNLLYDYGQRLHRQAPPRDVVIVAIDEQSLAQLGRWPWPRSLHARLVSRLHREGARAVALDMIFTEPDRTGGTDDTVLAQAIARAGNVILPVMLEQSSLSGQLLEVLPLPELTQAAYALGSVHAEIEADGIARGIFLREGLGSAHWLHFSEALAMAAQGRRASVLETEGQNDPYKVFREDYRRVPFLGPPGHFNTVSYVDVLNGNYPRDLFRNKLVLVGATAAGMGDRLPTPVSGLSEPMPGVEFHANALQAVRSGTLIRIAPTWLSLALTLLFSFFPVLLLSRLNPRAGILTSVAILLTVVVFALAVPVLYRLWIPPAPTLLAILIAYPVWSWRRLEAASRYLDQELDRLNQDLHDSAVAASEVADDMAEQDTFQARISRIQRVSQQLRGMRRLIDQVLEGMPHGVVALDDHGRAQLVNRRAQNWLEVKKGEQLPATLPVDREQCEINIRDGHHLLVDEAELDAVGIARVVNLVDISEIRKLEDERRETLAFLSHDIRAPLAGAIDQLKQHAGKDETLGRVHGQLQRSLQLAEEFLATARAETTDETQFQELDFADLVHQAVDSVYAIAQSRQVSLVRNITPEPVWVNGAFGLLERMAINLIQNAIKYSPPGAAVEISLQVSEDKAVFSVRDHGPGIAPEVRVRLFKRFSRVEGDRQDKVSGAGLGLYFVRLVAERHGGTAGVESTPGLGATFSVVLPALD